jgi:RNA polymerase sigma factor (TIGR02999 family)
VEQLSDDGAITCILARAGRGDASAREELLARVLGELRNLASGHMRGQPRQHSLQPTVLIHEAYLRLFREGDVAYEDRRHFFRVASRAMRCVLVDHARAKGRLKRAGGVQVPLADLCASYQERAHDLVALHEALERLGRFDARLVEVVELRFFGGRTEQEVAEIQGVHVRTVERDWRAARAWLQRELE